MMFVVEFEATGYLREQLVYPGRGEGRFVGGHINEGRKRV